MDKIKKLAYFGLFLALTCLLFYKGFFGYIIQGTDGPVGLVKQVADNIKNGVGLFLNDQLWMGNKEGIQPISIYRLALLICPPGLVTAFTYFCTVLLSLTFTFLFLRKLKLPAPAAVFGAIAYAFTPHFITAIYSGHILVLDMMAYPPMVFFFLSIVFDRDEKDLFKGALSVLMAGMAMGIMLMDDYQRGLYFALAAGAYSIYRIVRNCLDQSRQEGGLKVSGVAVPLGKGVLVLLVFGLCFANSLPGLFDTIQQRSALQNQKDEKAMNDIEKEQDAQRKWEFSTSWSFNPLEFIDGLAFGYHGAISGDEKMPYWGSKEFAGNSEALGYFVIFMSVIGCVFFLKKNNFVRFFLILGGTALVLSFGKWFPGTPFYWLLIHVPLMSNVRAPAKFIELVAFSLAVLSAFGVSGIMQMMASDAERIKKLSKNLLIGTGVFFGVGFIWMFAVMLASAGGSYFGIEKLPGMTNMAMKAAENMVWSLLRMNLFTLLAGGLFAAFFFLTPRFKERPVLVTAAVTALIALSAIDLWTVDWYYLGKSYIEESSFYKADSLIGFLKNDYQAETFRVGMSLVLPNHGFAQMLASKGYYLTYTFPYYGIQPMDANAMSVSLEDYNKFFSTVLQGSMDGPLEQMSTMSPMDQLMFIINMNLRLLRLANVKYLVTDGYLYPYGQNPVVIIHGFTNSKDLSFATLGQDFADRRYFVFKLKDYLPRAGFYENYLTVTNDDIGLFYLANKNLDIQNTVVVKAPVESRLFSSNRVVAQQVLDYKPWQTTVQVDAPADGFLLFTAKYFPEWKVTIDGQKAPLYQANYIQMGAFVKQGKHNVVLRFESDNRLYLVSLFTILAGLAGLAAYGVKYLLDLLAAEKKKEA